MKPVVDDTIFGVVKEERWVDSQGGYGSWLWCIVLAEIEVETLVVMVEDLRLRNRSMSMGVGFVDFVAWWLYLPNSDNWIGLDCKGRALDVGGTWDSRE